MAKPRTIDYTFGGTISNALKEKAEADIKGTEDKKPQDMVDNPADKHLLNKEAKSAEKNGWYLGKYAAKAYEGLKGRVQKILDRNNIKLDGEIIEQVNEKPAPEVPVAPIDDMKLAEVKKEPILPEKDLNISDLSGNWQNPNWNPASAGFSGSQIAGIQTQIGTTPDQQWGKNSRAALGNYLNSGNTVESAIEQNVVPSTYNPYVSTGYDFKSQKQIQNK